MIPALLWGVLTTAFVGYEFFALARDTDRWQPFTYYVRRVLALRDRTQPLWWLGLGFWLWLGWHFLLDS